MADNANHVGDLDGTLPDPNGNAGLGDDEIRTVKRVLLNDFAEIRGALTKPVDNSNPASGTTGLDHLTINTWEQRIYDLEQDSGGGGGGGDGNFIVGMITAFFGSSVPTGWSLCDGTNGTPDLRSRFILGSEVGSYGAGGSAQPATDAQGAHGHGLSISATTLTEAQIPAHRHYMFTGEDATSDKGNVVGDVQVARSGQNIGNQMAYKMQESTQTAFHGRTAETGGASGHTHSASIFNVSDHTHVVVERPLNYALAYIMYTG
jgi:microcystin-dependent protein